MSQLSNAPTRTFEKFLDQFLRPFECFFKMMVQNHFPNFRIFSRFSIETSPAHSIHFRMRLLTSNASKNFLWGLETCLKYVTTSPDLGLSNGTKIVAFGALEKIRHPYLKKRRPHLAFESYFSILSILRPSSHSEIDFQEKIF